MTAACTPSFSGHVVGDLVGYADCQARALGSWGYFNLATSPMLSTLLFVALSIAIALFGIRMMSGRVPTLVDTLSATAAIGIVLTLLFSWPAVRVLIYDTVLEGPQAVASVVMQAPDIDRTMISRVENADRGVQSVILMGTGRQQLAALNTRSGAPASSEFHGQAISESLAFATGRYLLLSSAIVSLGGLKLLGGLTIALLPLFALLILFRATAHHFVGAIAVLAALAIAGVATSILLMVELGFLEGWIVSTMESRAANYAIASAPIELLLIASLFAALQLMAVFLSFRLCMRAGRRVTVDHVTDGVLQQTSPGLSRSATPIASATVITMTRENRLVASLSRNSSYSQARPAIAALPSLEGKHGIMAHPDPAPNNRQAAPRATRTAEKRDRL